MLSIETLFFALNEVDYDASIPTDVKAAKQNLKLTSNLLNQ